MEARALVAVYRNEATAEAVVDEVRRRRGETAEVRIDDPHDRVTSVEAEVGEEAENALVAPQASFVFTKEMLKSIAVLVPVGAIIGALLVLPLAFVAFEDTSVGVRVFWALVVGAVMGGTIATIISAALGAKGPADQPAALVGVPVRVDAEVDDELGRMLAQHEPVRLDLVSAEGTPLATIVTEEQLTPDGIV